MTGLDILCQIDHTIFKLQKFLLLGKGFLNHFQAYLLLKFTFFIQLLQERFIEDSFWNKWKTLQNTKIYKWSEFCHDIFQYIEV